MQSQFIDPLNDIVQDPISDIKDVLLAIYLPSAATEPKPEVPPPPAVTPSAALAHLEGLLLFSLPGEPPANIMKLQDVLKREKKRIETLEIQPRTHHVQRRIADFLPVHSPSS